MKLVERQTASPGTDRSARSRRSARWQALIGLVVPVLAVALLPSPWAAWATLTGPGDARPADAVGGLVLVVASMMAWLLLAWAAAVVATAAAARLPGAGGVIATALLRHITPAATRRIVATAAGVSLATGLMCGTAAAAPPSATAAGTPAVAMSVPAPAVAGLDISPRLDAASGDHVPAGHTDRDTTSQGKRSQGNQSQGNRSHDTVGSPDTPLLPSLDWPHPDGDVAAAAENPPTDIADTAPVPTSKATTVETPTAGTTTAGTTTAGTTTAGTTTAGTTTVETPSGVGHEPVTVPETTTRPETTTVAGAPPAAVTHAVVTVKPGDCLWSLAAARLPADASIARIDAAWRAWYGANRDVIGPNPNLIAPGQQLRVPHVSEDST